MQAEQSILYRIQRRKLKLYGHLLITNGSLLPVGLPVNILKAFLPSSVLATCPVNLNFLDLITLTILGER